MSEHGEPRSAETAASPVVVPDRECWRVDRADRFALIVDAADFFRLAKQAMLKAERSILLIGWDFDARILLEPEEQTVRGPNPIGKFLEWLAKSRPALDVRILKWDIGLVHSLARGETPHVLLQWFFGGEIDFRLDSAHPPLSAQHMKILVIDDKIAFCGGIDMTVQRWDTRDHEEGRKGRASPRGEPLMPWHDVTSCVSGPAAVALAELARDRWRWATGETLDPVTAENDPWPDDILTDFRDIDVAIARTIPEYDDRPQISEIEKATVAIIEAAERLLYIESQYFASRPIAEVIAARLGEENGPEIVLVNPDSADGWLETEAMDTARLRLLSLVEKADRYGRFRAYYPENAAGTPIYVHAKVMIADDRLLKVGSANLNNRSMGYDSECDLIIDGRERPDVRERIAGIRDSLIAEHLGLPEEKITTALAETGSLIALIDDLNSERRNHLTPIPRRPLSEAEEVFAESDVADPIRPPTVSRVIHSLINRVPTFKGLGVARGRRRRRAS
ncbi:phospholipase D-like domain-containing protein [Acuticoccus sp. M5D2P5]|uniref:phospholipase D-like domain-containing protein n=1 Tax=Acuticoccus kalidii TaxID=2910977 RepID=UPI001F2A04B0|nr:phospholipase D-like domain-containing protein [Acuticoccus kalidii]MCF3932225.1 phospholipase D-like domain-containing protein [Acuticoccus kalidii]